MNKLKSTITVLLVVCLEIGLLNAQTQPASTSTPATKKTAPKSTAAKPAGAKPATTHMKKDGTPDMRYKENKPAGTVPAKKTSGTATPAKKAPTKAAPSKPSSTTGNKTM